jgi:hypothetical protein
MRKGLWLAVTDVLTYIITKVVELLQSWPEKADRRKTKTKKR